MYEAVDISYRIGNKAILNNINLTFEAGEFTAIIGANGAGKSTLFKILSNEQTTYDGQVIVNGQSIHQYKPRTLSSLRAVMSQQSHVQFSFTVRQIVSMGRYSQSTTSHRNNSIVDDVMQVTHTRNLADQNYLTLSGGEKQRVQLARVLAQVWDNSLQPRYVLLDEPTASMDLAQQQLMLKIVKQLCSEKNVGVLIIMHDLNLAAQFADRIFLMHTGSVVAHGTPTQVITKATIERAFGWPVDVHYDDITCLPFVIPHTYPSPSSASNTVTKYIQA